MTDEPIQILVTGATGNQGGAFAHALLLRGHNVRAMTRDIHGERSKALAKEGAELVMGDFTKPASVVNAAKGTEVAFVMATPFEKGVVGEVQHAKATIDAVIKGGAKHIIYTSVCDADHDTGIPHFDSKAHIESYLRGKDVAHTVVAPVFFRENLLSPWILSGLQEGELVLGLPPETPLQNVSMPELGAILTHIVEDRRAYAGQRIEIASSSDSGNEMAEALTLAMGTEIHYRQQPIGELRKESADFALFYEWLAGTGFGANIAATRKRFPDTPWTSFGQWAQAQAWERLMRTAEPVRR